MVASRSVSSGYVRRMLDPLVTSAAATPGADRYRKQFSALAHLWILLLHVMWASPSLRSTYAISFSQLARSSTSRPAACLETLLTEALALARRRAARDQQWRILQRVAVLDSTFVRLSACLSPWSIYGGAPAGIRLQTLLDLDRVLPSTVRMSLADFNDRAMLRQVDLTPWRGWTLLLDRGYYGHPQLARLQAAGVSFVARLISQVRYTILDTRPVPTDASTCRDRVVLDARIRLGSANNRTGAVLHNIRLVISVNQAGQELALVTDRHDLPAPMIVELYRRRWQIELFFRWLKRQLGLIRPLGRTRAAVWMTVLIVMIVAVISQLLAPGRPPGVSSIAWLHQTALALCLEFFTDG
jgi:transposase